jgi:hypothetical protein
VTDSITVLDAGQPIAFTFAEIMKYHGFGFPGGVAHAFKVMQRAFPLLDNGSAPERAELSMDTAFPGPGARDAFEMVTRIVTGGRYRVDPDLADDDLRRRLKGPYFFTFRYQNRAVDLTLKPGFVVDEFIALGAKQTRTPTEEARLTVLKTEMAERLLAKPADEVYDARVR